MSAKPRVRVRAGESIGVVINMAEYVSDEYAPDEDVMMAIEKAAHIVLEGDIVGIAIAFVHCDGATSNFYVNGPSRSTLLGATYRMMSRIQADEPI